MKIVAIIQARLNSKRLPNKVLADLCGRPMLWHIIERVKRSKWAAEVVVAFADEPGNSDLFISYFYPYWCPKIDVNDLIGRFYETAKVYDADLIVRICADNPFVDPAEIDRAIEYYMSKPCIFVSNMHQHEKFMKTQGGTRNGYPDGIGCEVFSISRLKWLDRVTKTSGDFHDEKTRRKYLEWREHPHLYFHEIGEVSSPKCPAEISRPDLRLDMNTQADLDYVRSIYEIVYSKNTRFTTKEVIEAIDAHHLERREVPAGV